MEKCGLEQSRIGEIRFKGQESSRGLYLVSFHESGTRFRVYVGLAGETFDGVGLPICDQKRMYLGIDPTNGISLNGLFVPPNERKNGMGKVLMTVLERTASATKSQITRTSKIRKPVMAQLLHRTGFEPTTEGIQMKITQDIGLNKSREVIPQVLVSSASPETRSGAFYEVAGITKEVDGLVTVNSRYKLERPEELQEVADETMRERLDVLRIFPRRVERAIS